MLRPFRFGVVSGSQSWTRRELAECARRVEASGYSTFQVSDHVAGPGKAMRSAKHPPSGLAAVPMLMAIADATDTLKVGSLVSCIDYHHPAVLAHEMATIDLLSEGRMEIGLGAGWTISEYDALGIPFDPPSTRISRLGEALTILKLLFSDGEITFEGDHYRMRGFEGSPRPVQVPYPPILVGGGSPKILRLAGKQADIVSINPSNRSGEWGPDGYRGSTAAATLRKIGWIREGAGDRFEDLELHMCSSFTTITNHASGAAADIAAKVGLSASDLIDCPHVLVGSIDWICDELVRRREVYGTSYVTVVTQAIGSFAPVVNRLSGK